MSDAVPLIVWIITGALGGWLVRVLRERGVWMSFVGRGVIGGFLGGFVVTCIFDGVVTLYTLPGAFVGSLIVPPLVEYVERHRQHAT